MNPTLKALVFEDFINKTKSELDDFTQLIGEIMTNSNELAGEAFDANTFITQHAREIRDMYLKNIADNLIIS